MNKRFNKPATSCQVLEGVRRKDFEVGNPILRAEMNNDGLLRGNNRVMTPSYYG